MKTIRIALGLALLFAILAVAFGTLVPASKHSTPYVAALSNVAVGTAEAVGCNNKRCNAGLCDNWDFYGCSTNTGTCRSTQCFP